jgi:hypothetical protein
MSRSDSLGLRDIYVAIWNPSLVLGSVGHVATAYSDGTVLTSEFPSHSSPAWSNDPQDWAGTLAREDGRWPDHVYSVYVPDSFDAGVQHTAALENKSLLWDAIPISWLPQTNCVVAAVKTLGSAGIPKFPAWWLPGLTPSKLNSVMQGLSTRPKT